MKGHTSRRCVLKAVFLSPDQDSYHLKERLVENEDFMLVPAEAWRKLLAWYGLVEGQPALERKVHLLTPIKTIET